MFTKTFHWTIFNETKRFDETQCCLVTRCRGFFHRFYCITTNPNNTLLFGQIPQHQINSTILASILNPPGPKMGPMLWSLFFLPPPKNVWENFGNHVCGPQTFKRVKNWTQQKNPLEAKQLRCSEWDWGMEHLPIPTCMVEFLLVNVENHDPY